jgi:glycosyltransferase involved in cell wall biosynthesis
LAAPPVVAYDLDWQGDLVETGQTGELVPFRDMEAMAAAAVRLLRDPASARAMGAAIRKRALAMLDPAALNEHERSEYRKLLARAHVPRARGPAR